jgi:hypothetical protein
MLSCSRHEATAKPKGDLGRSITASSPIRPQADPDRVIASSFFALTPATCPKPELSQSLTSFLWRLLHGIPADIHHKTIKSPRCRKDESQPCRGGNSTAKGEALDSERARGQSPVRAAYSPRQLPCNTLFAKEVGRRGTSEPGEREIRPEHAKSPPKTEPSQVQTQKLGGTTPAGVIAHEPGRQRPLVPSTNPYQPRRWSKPP